MTQNCVRQGGPYNARNRLGGHRKMSGNYSPVSRRLFCSALAILSLCILVFAASAPAQPAPLISGSPQLFIQRGQAADITLDGKYLGSVSSIAMSHPCADCRSISSRPAKTLPDTDHLHLHIAADADAALGGRELRFISSGGVSAPLYASVGQYPQLQEKEPNNTPEQAQEISFPVTLAGKIDPPGDVDCFKFTGDKRPAACVSDVHAAAIRN